MSTIHRRHFNRVAFAAALAIPAWGHAQNVAPLRVILPVSAGSGQDVMIRTTQTAMSKALGRPVIVENLAGSGGVIGTQQLVKAPADGNTIAFVSNNHSVNAAVFKNLPYDSLKDITPITVVAETPFLLVVNPNKLPASNVKEMQALLKAKPDHYNFGSSGNGTILHMAAEMFMDAAGVKAKHIPYRGAGPMINDLLSGQIDFGVLAVPAVQQHLKSGALRAVAATGGSRVGSFAHIQTLKEQGVDAVVGGWLAAIGPAKLPAQEIKRLNESLVAAWTSAEVRKVMAEQENTVLATTSEEAAAHFAREQVRLGDLARKINLKID